MPGRGLYRQWGLAPRPEKYSSIQFVMFSGNSTRCFLQTTLYTFPTAL